jgi:GntR family transcriptional regulator
MTRRSGSCSLSVDHVTIDRDAVMPLFLQLAGILRGRIESGEYPAGRRIPSRLELEQEFDLAPGTVVKALDTLKTEGLLISQQGRGTFVAEPDAEG